MSNGNSTTSLGVSLILITIVIFFIMLTAFIGYYVAKKYALSEKIQEKFYELK